MADLRINGWSNESLKCQHDLELKRELVALLSLSSWCLVMVVWHFLAVPCVCLRFVIVVFSGHTHYFGKKNWSLIWIQTVRALPSKYLLY